MAEKTTLKVSMKNGRPLRELAAFFLRLGRAAFGGPAGHIAVMEDELFLTGRLN
jgi:chromate transport protein ChrA